MGEVRLIEHAHVSHHAITHRRRFTRATVLWYAFSQPMLVESPRIIASDGRHGFVLDYGDKRVDRPAFDLFPLPSLSWALASNLIRDDFVPINVERPVILTFSTCWPLMTAVETTAGVPLLIMAVTRRTISSTGRPANSSAGR